MAALVSDWDALPETSRTPIDLGVEAAAMLAYLGGGSRIPERLVRAMLAAQRPDGGWPVHPEARRSDPHPTALALWVLLARLHPEAEPIRWVPPAR